MSRTIRIKLYKFNELSEAAKEKAIEAYRNKRSDYGYAWDAENLHTLKAFIDLFPIEQNRRGDGITFVKNRQIAEDIAELSGPRLMAYLWNNYRTHLFGGKQYHKRVGENTFKTWESKCVLSPYCCTLTGYCMDEDILRPIYDYLKKPTDQDFEELLHACYHAWERAVEADHEYQDSDECISEELANMEDEFTRDGKRY
jgi:hypothetical protein